MSEQWKLPQQVLRLLRILEDKGYEAYVVGGCVRDLYMGRSPHDWDICTNASPLEVMEAVRPLPVIETGLKHGTVTVLLDHVGYEVTTYRTEGNYSDGRHPDQVVFVKDLKEDLKRRDFTMNAMAYNPREGFVDLFGGREDLAGHMVRCVGEAKERFSEDVLRIMRAVRFSAVFSFEIEGETKRAIHDCVCDLPRVSVERITTEFRKMVMGRGFVEEVRQFPDLFQVFIPELCPLVGTKSLEDSLSLVETVQKMGGDEITVLAAFFSCLAEEPDFVRDRVASEITKSASEPSRQVETGFLEEKVVDRILRRLKFDNASREAVVTLIEAYCLGLPKGEKEEGTVKNRIRRLLGKLGEEALGRLFLLWEAQLCYRGEEMEDLKKARDLFVELLKTEGRIEGKTLAIGGRDLMDMGVPGGKQMGECLSHLLNQVLDGELPNEKEELKKAARHYFENAARGEGGMLSS